MFLSYTRNRIEVVGNHMGHVSYITSRQDLQRFVMLVNQVISAYYSLYVKMMKRVEAQVNHTLQWLVRRRLLLWRWRKLCLIIHWFIIQAQNNRYFTVTKKQQTVTNMKRNVVSVKVSELLELHFKQMKETHFAMKLSQSLAVKKSSSLLSKFLIL